MGWYSFFAGYRFKDLKKFHEIKQFKTLQSADPGLILETIVLDCRRSHQWLNIRQYLQFELLVRQMPGEKQQQKCDQTEFGRTSYVIPCQTALLISHRDLETCNFMPCGLKAGVGFL